MFLFSPCPMVKAVFGTLLVCDPTVREIIRKLDGTHHFVVEEFDATNLLVADGKVDLVRQEVERLLEQNVYS